MESTIVIKVKYGETLRRFTARIYENQLDLDMGGLREKIVSLFNFAPDAALTITYIDEDGDVVTLVDEEDLCDVMRQSLNPLRITVKLNTKKGDRSYARSSGSSTPMRSPQVQNPLPNLNTSIAEILKPVPEPFREALSKVSLDFASKAAYSAPGLTELVETFSKMGQSYIKSILESQTIVEPDTHASSGKDQEASKDGGVTSEVAPNMKSEEPMSKENQDPELGNGSHFGYYAFNECPFLGMPLANDQTGTRVQCARRLNPFKRSNNHSDGMGSVFHTGVACDGCDVQPITGPRFKSKVKEDYDLCSICFAKFGNKVDYVRMDRPVSWHRWSSMGLYDPIKQAPMHHQTLPDVLRSCGMKSKGPKLESCFIRDVTIPDGTVMAPSTPFTKVWRMRNNGSVVWPHGTQLVWIGGNKLSNTLSVKISADGLAVENEVDLAVDFTAPELPCRYISHWRMASPTGQKFGQRIWVDIQVDAALKDDSCFSLQFLNLNLPPESEDITGPGMTNVGAEPKSNDATELVKPIVEEPKSEEELNFPINDTLLVGPSESSSVSYPIIINLPEVVPTAPSDEPRQIANGPALDSVPEVGESNAVEQTLLRELKEMGFKQVDLNKEILRMNEYDLERSVDDLCGVAEWDPILEELQEMGFCDKETNQRLLKKNNGSIKRVVMDLIAGE